MSNRFYDEAYESVVAAARARARRGNLVRIALFGVPAAGLVAAMALAGAAGAARRGPDTCTYRVPEGYTVSTFAHMSPDTVDAIEERNGINRQTHQINEGETIEVACSDDLADLRVEE